MKANIYTINYDTNHNLTHSIILLIFYQTHNVFSYFLSIASPSHHLHHLVFGDKKHPKNTQICQEIKAKIASRAMEATSHRKPTPTVRVSTTPLPERLSQKIWTSHSPTTGSTFPNRRFFAGHGQRGNENSRHNLRQ